MFRFLLSLLLVISLALPANAISGADGQFFFRYKAGLGDESQMPVDDWASKTIHARFIGGVDVLFSELLPLKPEWEDDNWQVDVGTLPSGISFNASTRTFEGRPEVVQSGVNVILYGYDSNGVKVAKADVTFDIRELPANSVKVDLYAHTGKFFNNTIDLPAGVAITRWVETELPPGGVDYNGRYIEGTPVAKGQWPILNLGFEYGNDTPVFAYYGTITVEDVPQFPIIADQLKMVGGDYLAAMWDEWKVPGIIRAVGDPSKVRYYVERAPGEKFPGSVRATGDEFKRTISGAVRNYYEQATIRIKAIDSDATEGYSNWFQIGSLGPKGVCLPSEGPSIKLNGVVDKAFYKTGYPINTAYDASTKQFSVLNGTLPNNLTLDKDTGVINGTPLKQEQQLGVKIAINFPNNPLAQQVVCGPYDITIAPSVITLDATGNLDDYRVGSSLAVQLTPGGGLLAPYTVSMDANAVLPDTVSFDPTTGVLSGALNEAGVYSAGFTLTNGNGVTENASVTFEVHDPLKIDAIQSRYSIARLDSKVLFSFTYDTKAVIGTAVWDITGGTLPNGINLAPGALSVQGGTVLPEGSYGPYKLRLTDKSGSSTSTDEFWIDVTPRVPLEKNPLVPAVFGVNTLGNVQPFSVTQAPLAQTLYPLEYELNSVNDLPAGLAFDPKTGVITGTPLVKEVVDGFSVKITEQSPESLTATSETFSVIVDDPAPIGDLTRDYQMRGNKNGPWLQSRDLKSFLVDVQKRLVGGLAAVKFQSYSPQIPGISLNQATGVLEGIPTEEFSGPVKIDFVDGANRPGSLSFWITIYPYPELTTAAKYELPRLASASPYKIAFTPNLGFYTSITWALSPSSDPLPKGLGLSGGNITGSTDEPVGTIRNIEVEATNNANGIKVKKSLIVEVTARIPAKLEFPTDATKIYLDENTGAVAQPYSLLSSAYLTGSVVKPTVYTFGPATFPAWATINPSTGAIGGTPPSVRDWSIPVTATDAEGVKIYGTASIRSTLNGNPVMTPGDQSKAVRVSETFKTDVQNVANVVVPFTWKPATAMPTTFVVDTQTGAVEGVYDQTGSKSFTMNIEDAHERHFFGSGYTYRFDVKRPLEFSKAPKIVEGTQYSASNPLSVTFDEPDYAIDEVKYSVVGDVPGTPYVKTILPQTGLARYTRYDNQGNVVSVSDQQQGESTAAAEYRLEPDHLILDSVTLVFSGIPSKAGTFNMTLKAWDTHGNKYYKPSDSTRVAHNSAEQNFSVTVLPAIDLAVQNNADTESLYQYTSQPTIRTTISNDAYGRGVTWQKLSGSLPTNVVVNQGSTVLGYSGYPQTQGDFGNNVWRAVDLAGRAINTSPVSFHVGPRQTLELVSSRESPVPMVVYTEDAATKVTAKNAAYGPSIGVSNWGLTGQANLPPGVTATILADGVKFEGTSDKIGVYTGIQVRGTDPLGATAVYNLTFQVVASPFPIILNVYNVKTRVGYPIAMEPPFASNVLSTDNTYGKLRFYSDDLPQDVILDKDTGIIAGVVDIAQKLNFDLYVTDDTQRVTSEAVEIDIMPNLRVLVPTEIRVEPATVMNQPIATDYVMGKVQYAKGAGNWPANFEVDPDDGHIYSKTSGGKVTANIGTYSGLTIVATDTFISPTFGTLVDTQTSNTFSINIATAGSYIELKPTVLPDAEKRIAVYSFDFKPHLFRQNVDETELNWSLLSNSANGWRVPPGMSITNGVMSGTPTTEGTYTFGVRAVKKNQAAIITTVAYTLDVKLPKIALELDDHVFANVKRDDPFDFDMKSLISVRANIELADIRFTKTTAAGSSTTSGVSMNGYGQFSGNWTNIGTYIFDVEAKFTSGNETISSKKTYSVTVKGNSYAFKQISAGGYHTCAVDTDSELTCWGAGGRTGHADASVKKLPEKVDVGTIKQVSSGNAYSCAIRDNGELICWGFNSYGQLGNGSSTTSYTPVSVGLPGPVTDVVAGRNHTCAVVSGTDLYCWGLNSYGQLGNGDRTTNYAPILAASEPQGIISLALGASQTCYVRANGTARCVGLNSYGNLGTNNTTVAYNWVETTVISGIKKIQMDTGTTCVLTDTDSVQCYGLSGDNYKLGTGTTTSYRTPRTPVGLGSGVKDMVFSESSGCAIMKTGETLCWGMGDDGKMGDNSGATNRTPGLVSTTNAYGSLTIGNGHVCALLPSGSAECWGSNASGQLGNGTQSNKFVPTLVE